ncbi:tetratricopeptide repeat protein [Aliiglaciecola sp. M165]|uniref:tetratricopeptide repeat protein n=1 Tax=Aliiglaciecola sp. M165 TaxID=2593649 RepID=UPI00163DD7FC
MKRFAAISQKTMSLLLAFSMAISGSLLTTTNAVAEVQKEQKTKRTPALRSKVYDQLARAQALADMDKIDEALDSLKAVERKSSSMNSYELAMMYNFFGFIYYNAEDYDNAIASFEKVVAQQPIPESFEKSTLFSLSQLHMMRGNYDKTVSHLEKWEALHDGEIPAKNLVLKAQAMYQKKDYVAASGFINAAIEQQESSELGFKVEESWYVLQRAVYYELKNPKKVTEVLVKMVKQFNKPEYWVQLSGMYGELGLEKEQLAILESAYQQGFVNKANDLFNLAQLYYYHQAPFKAAKIIEQAIDHGVLDNDLRNLKFLAQSWSLAKEDEKAVPVMLAAAQMSSDGELDMQLAQIFLNMEKYDDAIEASQRAIDKGDLRNPGNAHLILGMALFNKQRFVASLTQLAKAEEHQKTEAMAKRWSQFVKNEQEYFSNVLGRATQVGS